jgi:hypothetical protein
MLFLSTNILHFRERISFMKMCYFQRPWRIMLFLYYNLILNIKVVMCMKRYTNYWTPLRKHTGRAAKIIFGPQGKRKLGSPPPILQIVILKLSPPRCIISKESVQQTWIDELWFRKQLSTCLFVMGPGAPPRLTPSQWVCAWVGRKKLNLYHFPHF